MMSQTYRKVVVVQVRIVSIELEQLYLNDPVLFSLCHQSCIFIFFPLCLLHILMLVMLLPWWRTLVVGAVGTVFVTLRLVGAVST